MLELPMDVRPFEKCYYEFEVYYSATKTIHILAYSVPYMAVNRRTDWYDSKLITRLPMQKKLFRVLVHLKHLLRASILGFWFCIIKTKLFIPFLMIALWLTFSMTE